jgi:hypothetical protein
MEQTSTVILKYTPAQGREGDPMWEVEGREMKFIRVIVGLGLPQLDRQSAAVVVLGELRRNWAAPDWTGLAAAVGTWPEVKNALASFCRDLKPDHLICENEQSRKLVFPVTDSLVGITPVNVLSYVAPAHAITEVGRQNVQGLINEDRLHIGNLLAVMDHEPDQANRALQLAVNWAIDFPAIYRQGQKSRGPLDPKLFGREGL